jgi:hypothetical protein
MFLSGLLFAGAAFGAQSSNFLVDENFTAQVKHATLHEDKPLSCPMRVFTTLTIRLPGPLEGLAGIGFVSDAEKKKGDYSLSYAEGRNFLSIAPRHESAPPRNLNIILDGKTYVLIPRVTNNSSEALMSLILTKDERPLPSDSSASMEAPSSAFKKRSVLANSKIKSPAPAQLLGLIDALKLLATVEGQEKTKLVKLMKHLDAEFNLNQKTDFGTYMISVNNVVRHKEIDALGLELTIQNLKKDPLIISPESFSVRVGDYVFDQSMSDAPSVIEPYATSKAYVVICGNGEGGLNWLSVGNLFTMSVDLQ